MSLINPSLTEMELLKLFSTKSKTFHELNINIDEISRNDTLPSIIKHPQMVRRPIILDEKDYRLAINEERNSQILATYNSNILKLGVTKLADL